MMHCEPRLLAGGRSPFFRSDLFTALPPERMHPLNRKP